MLASMIQRQLRTVSCTKTTNCHLNCFFFNIGFSTCETQIYPAQMFSCNSLLAVLAGDLGQFNDVIMNYKDKFIAEKTYTLIIRYVLE